MLKPRRTHAPDGDEDLDEEEEEHQEDVQTLFVCLLGLNLVCFYWVRLPFESHALD